MDVEVIETNKVSDSLSVTNEGKFPWWFQKSLIIILHNFRENQQPNLYIKFETVRNPDVTEKDRNIENSVYRSTENWEISWISHYFFKWPTFVHDKCLQLEEALMDLLCTWSHGALLGICMNTLWRCRYQLAHKHNRAVLLTCVSHVLRCQAWLWPTLCQLQHKSWVLHKYRSVLPHTNKVLPLLCD